MLAACYGLVHDNCMKFTFHVIGTWGMGIVYQMHDLHVTGVSTRWLYHCLHNWMLRDWYYNIPNSDCEHGISYYSTYHSRLCFSDIDRFCMDFVSSRLCWIICSLSFYPCQRISWVCGFHNLLSFAIAATSFDLGLKLRLEPSTGIHISVEVVMFLQLPNSY